MARPVDRVRYFIEVQPTILPPCPEYPLGNIGYLLPDGKPATTPVLQVSERELKKICR